VKIPFDPIISPSDLPPDPVFPSNPDNPLLKSYQKIDEAYFKAGSYYKRQFLLKFLAQDVKNSYSWDSRKALSLVFHISSIFHLNLLEIIYWGILLHKVPESHFRPGLFAYFTAYEAKTKLNSDMSLYDAYINERIPNFRVLYSNWQIIVDIFEPTVKDMAVRYCQMSKIEKNFKNYEKMVDGIVEMPRRKESIVTEVTETSNLEEMKLELEVFQRELMNGEKLSPI
jgi:hypothetical protein